MDKSINPEIFEYIKEIADKMVNNRASVMVGAGFSKNADKIAQTDKKFLDWNALGDVFYKKINGRDPAEERYLNVLKLAEEVEVAYGRAVLNQLIRESLPDDEYVPSKLHEKLLNLYWKDVFTTNYDTLLERTLEKVTDRHYSVILNKEDLIYSVEPRIIKLHGSFPSTLPFIITEEDYRQYPKNSAVFVNTVQQTLIENVLCLIGFSGDDPNFLQWIGWVRDNLGKDMASKIYLVGVFNFSAAELSLLQKRNIIVLNMAKCKGIGKNAHKDGLELFLNALSALTKPNDESNWPKENNQHIPFEKDDIEQKIQAVINEWKKTRVRYPGWFILPREKRKWLLMNTESCDLALTHITKDSVNIKLALEFLYEYNWRINKCLRPIFTRELKAYEKIVLRFNPFPDIIHLGNNEVIYNPEESDSTKIKDMWLELLLDMLRAYRENGQFSNINKVIQILDDVKKYLTKEQLAKYKCEIVRGCMFQLKIGDAKKALDNWPRDISLPEWEIKRAGMLMELGDISQAFKIITDELAYIRKGHTTEINYYKISIEAYLKLLASLAKQVLKIDDQEFAIKSNTLYNPAMERKLFEASLKEQPKPEYEKETFDLNRITRTIVSAKNESYIEAYQFIRYFEEIGMPFDCNHIVSSKNACIEAIRRITPFSLLWSIILQVKIRDNKTTEKIWARETIASMKNDEIELISKFCIDSIKNNMEFIEKGDRWYESNFSLGIAAIMPDILSRLCTRMPEELQLETLKTLDIIYRSNTTKNFLGVDKLANRLVKSMSENMKIRNFDKLAKMYLHVPDEIEKREWADIFSEFSYQEKNIKKYSNISMDDTSTDILLQLMEKDDGRGIAICRLAYLYKFELLTSRESELFKNLLWDKTDEHGLPIIPDIYSKNYLFDLPVPQNVNLKRLIKNYILSLSIPTHIRGISFNAHGDVPMFLIELDLCTYSMDNKNGLKWTAREFDLILNKILKAWDSDKKYFLCNENDKFGLEIRNEIYEKYHTLDNVLSKIINSNNLKINDKHALSALIDELKKFGLQYIQLKIIIDNETTSFDEIYNIICSSDDNKIVSVCNTIYSLASMKKSDYKKFLLDLLEKLSVLIRTRRTKGLTSIIYLMHNLIYSDLLPENAVIIDNILFGLDCLLEETKLDNNTLNLTVNQCINLRAAANSLAYITYQKYSDNTDVREVLTKWKIISQDMNEFSEVRNKWLDI